MGVGTVYIVGAGPGPADLITVRGLRALEKAEVVIVDELLPRTFLDDLDLPIAHEQIIWRNEGDEPLSQEQVNRLLVEHALAGRTVVRLKGGDPGVFGRGWEEAALLSHHGIPWELVPGLTAGTGLPALAGLSLTHRGEGRSFAIATGRLRRGELNYDLPRADSLVLYMSVSALPDIAGQLLDDRWAPDAPAAIIERGGLVWERRFHGPLAEIAQIADDAQVRSPSLIIIGEAARRRVNRPLVLFTGLDPANFGTLGDPIHWPALQVVDARDARQRVAEVLGLIRLQPATTFVFTSKTASRAFFRAARDGWKQLDLPAQIRVVAAGPGTADVLRRHGLHNALEPRTPGGAGIADLLRGRQSGPCVLVQGAQARGSLARELEPWFNSVLRLTLHEALPHPELGETPLPDHDAIYFTSPSGVHAYHERFGVDAFRQRVLCIGEPTREALSALGIEGKVVHPGVFEPAAHSPETQPAFTGVAPDER